jgi:hypothetical protein
MRSFQSNSSHLFIVFGPSVEEKSVSVTFSFSSCWKSSYIDDRCAKDLYFDAVLFTFSFVVCDFDATSKNNYKSLGRDLSLFLSKSFMVKNLDSVSILSSFLCRMGSIGSTSFFEGKFSHPSTIFSFSHQMN